MDCLRLHHHKLRLTSLILRGVTSVRGPHAAHGQGGAGQLLQRPGPRRDAGPAGGRVVCPRVRCSRDLSPHRLVGGELYPRGCSYRRAEGNSCNHRATLRVSTDLSLVSPSGDTRSPCSDRPCAHDGCVLGLCSSPHHRDQVPGAAAVSRHGRARCVRPASAAPRSKI